VAEAEVEPGRGGGAVVVGLAVAGGADELSGALQRRGDGVQSTRQTSTVPVSMGGGASRRGHARSPYVRPWYPLAETGIRVP
jgi:hypothetical protein